MYNILFNVSFHHRYYLHNILSEPTAKSSLFVSLNNVIRANKKINNHINTRSGGLKKENCSLLFIIQRQNAYKNGLMDKMPQRTGNKHHVVMNKVIMLSMKCILYITFWWHVASIQCFGNYLSLIYMYYTDVTQWHIIWHLFACKKHRHCGCVCFCVAQSR